MLTEPRPLLATAFILLLSLGTVASSGPRNTVFWISIDGLRPDYLERAETPFFDRLRNEGAFSHNVSPAFPSVTFSSHISQATGVRPENHGITGNSFYDSQTRQIYHYPGQADLLQAEPIWITASRQGIRAAVLDWPLAHSQSGPVTSAYFGEKFDAGLRDEERLGRLLQIWKSDGIDPPLRLILGYATSPDAEGHRHGPDSEQVTKAVQQIDGILARTFDQAIEIWQDGKPAPEDRFFLIVTSDHGMSPVTTLIHPGNLTGLEGREGVVIVTTGNVAHIHLDGITDQSERRTVLNRTLARLAEFDYLRAFPRDRIPAKWGLRHPTRTGDILLVLDTGYTFNRGIRGIEEPIETAGGPLGMHGYEADGNPEMFTPLFIFRFPDPAHRKIPGEIAARQLHATVCEILGIRPAPGALKEPIDWDPSTPHK